MTGSPDRFPEAIAGPPHIRKVTPNIISRTTLLITCTLLLNQGSSRERRTQLLCCGSSEVHLMLEAFDFPKVLSAQYDILAPCFRNDQE